jgi:hypothetical protein
VKNLFRKKTFELPLSKYKEYLDAGLKDTSYREKIQNLEDHQAVNLARVALYEYLILQRKLAHEQRVNKLDTEFLRYFNGVFSDALHNLPCDLDEPENLKRELLYLFKDLEATKLFLEENSYSYYRYLFEHFLELKRKLDDYAVTQ